MRLHHREACVATDPGLSTRRVSDCNEVQGVETGVEQRKGKFSRPRGFALLATGGIHEENVICNFVVVGGGGTRWLARSRQVMEASW